MVFCKFKYVCACVCVCVCVCVRVCVRVGSSKANRGLSVWLCSLCCSLSKERYVWEECDVGRWIRQEYDSKLLSDYNKSCHISYIFLFKCYHIHMHTQTCSSLLPEPVVPHKHTHTHTHTHTHISAQKMDFPLLEGLPQGFFFLVEVWAHLF